MTKMKNPECFDIDTILTTIMNQDEKFNILITQGNLPNDAMKQLLMVIPKCVDFDSVDMSYIGNTLTIKMNKEEK